MVYEVLGTGEKEARTAEDIARGLNMCSREVMRQIRRERLEGFPICASSKGYYAPEDRSEVENTIQRLYATARNTKEIANAMNKMLKKGGLRNG